MSVPILLPILFRHSSNCAFWSVEHPPYSPDLTPSDYLLFGHLKNSLRGRRFGSDHELKEAVHTWLAARPKKYFPKAYRSLCKPGPSVLKNCGPTKFCIFVSLIAITKFMIVFYLPEYYWVKTVSLNKDSNLKLETSVLLEIFVDFVFHQCKFRNITSSWVTTTFLQIIPNFLFTDILHFTLYSLSFCESVYK
jgi:hypothetical protein